MGTKTRRVRSPSPTKPKQALDQGKERKSLAPVRSAITTRFLSLSQWLLLQLRQLDDIRLVTALSLAGLVLHATLGVGCHATTCALLIALSISWAFLLWFYTHTVRIVFNRVPTYSKASLYTYFKITRPLELVFRLATCWLRVTPDALILGEVRCGTTTLASHMATLPGAHPPFCPWKIDFADSKESFFMVGHFFGLCHPFLYRSVFPTVLEKWWARLRGEPFFCYDACAQYLTAPWVASQLSIACPSARLVACVRDPTAQNLSWWRFEQGAMAWAASPDMALGSTFIPARTHYPPSSLAEAMRVSQNNGVGELYDAAEALGVDEEGRARAMVAVPEWAATWPGGQLVAMWHSARYARNLRRYLRFFAREQLMVVEIGELAPLQVEQTKQRLAEHVRGGLGREFAAAWREQCDFKLKAGPAVVHRNAGQQLGPALEPSTEEVTAIRSQYRESNEELFELIGRRFDW